jgi:DNA repair photolyase
MKNNTYQKGRGAQINPHNHFHTRVYDEEMPRFEGEEAPESLKTQYIPVHPKSMLNKVDSPDIGPAYSMNPYQGCEHGCVYCYARNTHNYWGYSAGLEFEQKILVKEDAPRVLEATIRKPSWKAEPIMLAGNTDCYQPAERRFGITRRILEVLWKYRHPVGIITKNSLILRDLDLLGPMAKLRLAKASISLTSLDEDLRRRMEPRTASAATRLRVICALTEAGVPVNVMLAPIIPGLNDHEILPMAKAAAEAGAASIAHTVVRLNGDVARIFEHWLRENFPERANKVLNKIRDCHGGQLGDSRFGLRMTGEGHLAEMIARQMRLAKKLYFNGKEKVEYNLELHDQYKNGQLRLF